MKSGYDQFFKAARKAKAGERPAAPAMAKPKASAARKAKRSVSDEELEKRLRAAFRMKAARKKAPVPWLSIFMITLISGLAGWFYVQPDVLRGVLSKIEIQAFGHADAEEKKSAKTDSDKSTKTEESAAGREPAAVPTTPEATQAAAQDTSYFSKLNDRKLELDRREKELTELEEELQRQKVEVETRIRYLEDVRNQIGTLLKDRVEVDQEKVNKLVEFYSNMKPKQAADILGQVDEDLAVEVLSKMKKKNAAEIMNLLSAEKARALSEKFTGYKRR